MNGNSRIKLSNEQIEEIRFIGKNTHLSQIKIAKQFGVCQKTISKILRNEIEAYKISHKLILSEVLKAANKCLAVKYKAKKVNYVKTLYGGSLTKAVFDLNRLLLKKKLKKKFKKKDIELIEKAHYQLINFGFIGE